MKINTNYQLNKLPQSRPHFTGLYMNTDEIADVINDADTTRIFLDSTNQLKALSDTVDTIVTPRYDGTITVRVQKATPHVAETTHPVLKPLKQAWRAITMWGFKPYAQEIFSKATLSKRNLIEITASIKDAALGTTRQIEAAARLV